ncbi:uncharacterized protein LOC107633574 isoform X3 [Arachis ipaensis]|uniref:uncharacterized protein LOC107633574 isoform X3 n=1 Tax=Arachis ipaensis TaxID=130454 RepID=UPI0007AF7D6E|nr:uncharacterized protein LOC107633574 isoform X3 [Arachis ipaensis]XP_025629256.1 uncharacterized protein LOC112722452 isoform X3 [Arachis hypogaea]
MRLGCRHRRREGESRRNPSPCTPSPKSIEWGRRNRGLPPSLEMAVGLRKPRHTPVAAGNVIDALGVSHWSCDCSVLGFFCAKQKHKQKQKKSRNKVKAKADTETEAEEVDAEVESEAEAEAKSARCSDEDAK